MKKIIAPCCTTITAIIGTYFIKVPFRFNNDYTTSRLYFKLRESLVQPFSHEQVRPITALSQPREYACFHLLTEDLACSGNSLDFGAWFLILGAV